MWVVTRHQYGISTLVSQTPFRGETVLASRDVGCFLRLRQHGVVYLLLLITSIASIL